MRPYPTARARGRHIAAALLALAPLSVPASGLSAAGADTSTAVPMALHDAHLTLGQPLEAHGTLPASDYGRSVVLRYRPAGATDASTLASAPVTASGAYSVRAHVQTNGEAHGEVRPRGTSAAAASATVRRSADRSVRVASSVRHGAGKLDV